MPETQFWNLISELHGSNSDSAYRRLTVQLESLTTTQILGFDARMTIDLYELDDQCRAKWYSKRDPSGLGFVADDDFLYFRADTVTAGEAVWREAATTDTLPWGTTDAVTGDGENLLYVGLDAAHARGISNDKWIDLESKLYPLSYETGSNPAGWPTS